MELIEKLRQWGAVHGAARDAERRSAADVSAHREAQRLRERADRLHQEIYRSLDKPSAPRQER